MLRTAAFARVPFGRDSPNNPSLATPSATTEAPMMGYGGPFLAITSGLSTIREVTGSVKE
jgi:hypothetical protein